MQKALFRNHLKDSRMNRNDKSSIRNNGFSRNYLDVYFMCSSSLSFASGSNIIEYNSKDAFELRS